MAPLLCKNCFLKRQPSQFPTPPVREEYLDVEDWDCFKCGAPLEPEEVNGIKNGQAISCEYCGATITKDLFK
ncbi:MAG: hypothetical protein EAX95_09960 [Candidatus Thorarchaeota archaeon]|nr:hypothetical protein [Candidatus Thorarchaeota archaeon]